MNLTDKGPGTWPESSIIAIEDEAADIASGNAPDGIAEVEDVHVATGLTDDEFIAEMEAAGDHEEAEALRAALRHEARRIRVAPEVLLDPDGEPIRPDPHSPDWYDGYANGQRDCETARRNAPEGSREALLADLEACAPDMRYQGDHGPEHVGWTVPDHLMLRLRSAIAPPSMTRSADDLTPQDGIVRGPLVTGREAWAMFYEDPSHGHEVFSGYGSESAAMRRFEQARQTWNCTLFRQFAPMGWAIPTARGATQPPDRGGEALLAAARGVLIHAFGGVETDSAFVVPAQDIERLNDAVRHVIRAAISSSPTPLVTDGIDAGPGGGNFYGAMGNPGRVFGADVSDRSIPVARTQGGEG
jgi:hypothetical protein